MKYLKIPTGAKARLKITYDNPEGKEGKFGMQYNYGVEVLQQEGCETTGEGQYTYWSTTESQNKLLVDCKIKKDSIIRVYHKEQKEYVFTDDKGIALTPPIEFGETPTEAYKNKSSGYNVDRPEKLNSARSTQGKPRDFAMIYALAMRETIKAHGMIGSNVPNVEDMTARYNSMFIALNDSTNQGIYYNSQEDIERMWNGPPKSESTLLFACGGCGENFEEHELTDGACKGCLEEDKKFNPQSTGDDDFPF